MQSIGMKDDGVYIRLDAPNMAEKGISYDPVMSALQANIVSVP